MGLPDYSRTKPRYRNTIRVYGEDDYNALGWHTIIDTDVSGEMIMGEIHAVKTGDVFVGGDQFQLYIDNELVDDANVISYKRVNYRPETRMIIPSYLVDGNEIWLEFVRGINVLSNITFKYNNITPIDTHIIWAMLLGEY